MDIQQKSASRYLLTALASILVITAFLLIGLNAFRLEGMLGQKPKKTLAQAYAEGYRTARQTIASQNPIMALSQTSMLGEVISNNGSSLVVMQKNLDTNPAVDGISDERTIIVDTKTLIERSVSKPTDQFLKELSAIKDVSSSKPPSNVTLSVIRLSDIKVGETIRVESANDLRLMSSIPALHIIVLP